MLLVAAALLAQLARAALPPPPASVLLLDAFVQAAPVAGAAPTRRTELRLWPHARAAQAGVEPGALKGAMLVPMRIRRQAGG